MIAGDWFIIGIIIGILTGIRIEKVKNI